MHVDVNGARLWVEEAGEGPAVVFLHGGLGDSRLWEPVASLLADAFRCVRYDLRFFGRSDGPGEEWSSLDDVVGVLDALGIERAALVGLSMGGAIALDVALAHPERVWAVAHVAGGVTGAQFTIEGVEEPPDDADPETVMALDLALWAPLGADERLRDLWRATPDARGLPEGARPRPRPAARVDDLDVPILVITARHDPAAFQEIARRIPDARLVEVDSDHYLTLREPERVTELLRDFLTPTAPQQ